MKTMLSSRKCLYLTRVPSLLITVALIAALAGCGSAATPAQYSLTISQAGYHTVGLKSDGTVVAVGDNDYGQCDVGGWTDIIQVAAGGITRWGLSPTAPWSPWDGTTGAVRCRRLDGHRPGRRRRLRTRWGLSPTAPWSPWETTSYGQCDVGGWTDIIQVAAGYWHTVGLKSDGTVVAVGYNYYGQCDVGGWTDIIQVAAGGYHTVGLKSDGTVVAVGDNTYGQCNVGDWTDIIQVAAGSYHTVGLKSDGTVVAVGYNDYGQCDVRLDGHRPGRRRRRSHGGA
jgi:alpha-tubulin suppressor-like RCC1 family protein